jgi:hypothetical protein
MGGAARCGGGEASGHDGVSRVGDDAGKKRRTGAGKN